MLRTKIAPKAVKSHFDMQFTFKQHTETLWAQRAVLGLKRATRQFGGSPHPFQVHIHVQVEEQPSSQGTDNF